MSNALLEHSYKMIEEIETLRAENAKLREELETERMRLTACGVVALANTPGTAAADLRQMKPEYRSGSLRAVKRIVDSEMALREEVKRLREQRDRLVEVCNWAQQELLMHDEDCGGDFNGEVSGCPPHETNKR